MKSNLPFLRKILLVFLNIIKAILGNRGKVETTEKALTKVSHPFPPPQWEEYMLFKAFFENEQEPQQWKFL